MSNKINLILTGLTFVCMVGCASNPSITSLSSIERQKVAEMMVFEAGSIPRDSYQILGTVEGIACKRNLYASDSPSMEEAKQGARIRAVQLNTDAVINMICEDKRETDWGRNCWQTVVCVGDAISLRDKSLIPRPSKQ